MRNQGVAANEEVLDGRDLVDEGFDGHFEIFRAGREGDEVGGRCRGPVATGQQRCRAGEEETSSSELHEIRMWRHGTFAVHYNGGPLLMNLGAARPARDP